MRGKEHVRLREQHGARITPAYAGKRRCPRFRPGKIRDHPRMCGEKRAEFVFSSALVGSPPHVRGKAPRPHRARPVAGITPACAGKRLLPPSDDTREWDHPRMCGEKKERIWEQGYIQGSPPRMRGKGCLPALAFGHVGITPAYAGKRCGTIKRFLVN